METPLSTTLHRVQSLTLDEVQALQTLIDEATWTGPNGPREKTCHVMLHLAILLGKLARQEERRDHGAETADATDDVIGDLVVYAAQLSELQGVSLALSYRNRIEASLAGCIPHVTT